MRAERLDLGERRALRPVADRLSFFGPADMLEAALEIVDRGLAEYMAMLKALICDMVCSP